jgi:hypothetical protein
MPYHIKDDYEWFDFSEEDFPRRTRKIPRKSSKRDEVKKIIQEGLDMYLFDDYIKEEFIYGKDS